MGPIFSVAACLVALWLGGCGRWPLGISGSDGSDGGVGATDDARALGHIVCGESTCFVKQVCCVTSGQCVDEEAAASKCPKPAQPSMNGKACGSNADCAASEFCAPQGGCIGAGICTLRSNCGTSTGGPGFCGCDGVTYPSVQAACLAGVQTSGRLGACGVAMDPRAPGQPAGSRDPIVYCGFDGQCPAGQKCCAVSGRCYDSAIPYLCTAPPAGARAPCLEDRQCDGFDFCFGDGCSGPGGCIPMAGQCNGQLEPVCGCDGKSYVNASCVIPVGVRVAHSGTCGGSDAGSGD